MIGAIEFIDYDVKLGVLKKAWIFKYG